MAIDVPLKGQPSRCIKARDFQGFVQSAADRAKTKLSDIPQQVGNLT
jgi:hypothetical protein